MSQPTAYYPVYNFTQYQAAHPSTPLPGASVDSELFSISESITEICLNLKMIQRDDGAIANNSIGYAQLQPGVSIGLALPATNWQSGVAYVINAIVYQSNSVYICAKSHTSGVFATDLAAANWTLLLNTGQYVAAAAASATAAANSASNAAASAGTAGNVYVGAGTGTDNITVTPSPALGAWTTGLQLRFATAGANTSATPAITPSGLTAKNIKKVNGSGVVVNPAIGDLVANSHAVIEYDGTQALILGARAFSQSAAIATASTLNLDNATGVYVPLTGTTTVTVITLALGEFRRCVAGSGFTLTNGASLICPTAANIAVAAGDTFDVFGEATGVVRVTNFQRASGNPLVVSAMTIASAAATLTGGTVDGMVVGGVTKAAGSFTTLLATGLLDISGAAAGQISFPAAQNASSGVNVLDDYEEGSFTPADGSGASLSFTSVVGQYTKIGRAVYVHAVLVYPSTANGSNASIGGWPFSCVSGDAGGAPNYSTLGTAFYALLGSSVCPLYDLTGAAKTNANMSLKALMLNFVYNAAT